MSNARIIRAIPALLLLVVIPMRADAQLGGLLKKAKEKITAPDQPSAQGTNVSSNAQIGDPFDAASLEATIAGLKIYKTRMADVDAINKQIQDSDKTSSALQEKNKKTFDEFMTNDAVIRNCISADMEARAPAREAAMQAKMMEMMSDQKMVGEITKAAQALTQATQKGDTASQRKLLASYMKLLGVSDDSVATFKKCGRPPAKPAAMTELERLAKEREALTNKSRQAASSADIDAARTANTSPAKFQKQRERLQMYPSNKRPFSPAEQALIDARRAEINPLIK